MRFIVALLALLGTGGAAVAGFILLIQFGALYLDMERATNRAVWGEMADRFAPAFIAAVFYFIGAGLVFFGAIFAAFRCGKSAAFLFFVAAVGPVVLLVMSPWLARIAELAPALGASGFLLLLTLLSLVLVKPKPVPVEE